MATNEAAVGGLSLAGILAASPMGLSMQTILIGTAFAALGVIGRAAFEAQRYSENTGTMKLSQILAWLGGGLVSAPTMTVLWLALLQSMSVKSDAICIFGLIFLGWSGPKGAAWLISLARNAISSKIGGNPPQVDGDPKP